MSIADKGTVGLIPVTRISCTTGGFPGQYAARRLFGWLDGEYDRQYWQRLERNWKQCKSMKLAGGVKGRLTAVCEVVEEEGGKIEEWNEEDEMGQMGDASSEL